MKNTSILFIICLSAVFLAGCANPNPQGRLQVEGEVTLKGSPVANGGIEFEPCGTQKDRVQSGGAITDGRYSLSTVNGLAPGDYTVRISVMEEVPGSRVDDPDPMKSKVEYRNAAPPEFSSKTTQKISVVAGQKNKFDFKM